jgi:hypothetical protein
MIAAICAPWDQPVVAGLTGVRSSATAPRIGGLDG